MSEFSGNHGYEAARNLRGRKLELAGATYANREWLKSEGASYDKTTKTWSVPIPGNNRDKAQLLYEITKRGIEWRAI